MVGTCDPDGSRDVGSKEANDDARNASAAAISIDGHCPCSKQEKKSKLAGENLTDGRKDESMLQVRTFWATEHDSDFLGRPFGSLAHQTDIHARLHALGSHIPSAFS